MALSPQLLQFKSSGVYRLEFDKSITADLNVETLRLIVGHSKKGPYNTPVLIKSSEDFINVFGSIDRSLEKKGMFFHRSAFEALSRGPILALNLTSFGELDLASYAAPVTNGAVASLSSDEDTTEYASFFDVDKFMTPSDAAVLTAVNGDDNHLLNFVNIKQNGITIIVRQAQDVKAFQITAREWYGEGNVPSHLNAFDYMSDFMVDVFVFKGEFDAAAMSIDPVYGSYFTEGGLDKTKLEEFANLRQVTLEAKYTGSLLPGFKDLEGRNLYIESIINNESRRTGLFCAVNEDVVLEGGLDLVGHSYDVDSDYELLSYVIDNSQVTGPFYAASTVTLPDTPVTTAVVGSVLTITDYNATTTIPTGSFLEGAAAGTYVSVTTSYDAVSGDSTITCSAAPAAAYDGIDTTAGAVDITKYTEFYNTSPAGAVRHGVLAAGFTYAASGSMFTLTYANPAPATIPMSVGDYVVADEAGRLSRINRISKSGDVYTVYCEVNVPSAWDGTYIKSFENAATHYKTFVLSAADLQDKKISDILSVLTAGSGVYNGLIDKDMIDFRYVVDTFSSYDSTGILNKRELASLAKDRQNAAAILNAPTVGDFKLSTDPSFTNADGVFRVDYIADGGNLDKNPTKLYSLPSINEGANYAFYYGPGLIVSDNGKDIIVPPAAYVSNNFIDKYTAALPWSIVAGPRRGVVSGTNVKGAEYAFDKADRDVLEPFGYNPIVFQRGVGLTILGNKTAQQSVKSALSSAHVREVLIYIQEGIANILKDYVFEFNNTQTRLEIKTLADSFMESVKQDGGVYDFKNIMDQTNNTDDVIDNNYGIIDTYVEPVKGLEIVVHRTTVLNTGEIQTGNFN
jgi:hypothetical protein